MSSLKNAVHSWTLADLDQNKRGKTSKIEFCKCMQRKKSDISNDEFNEFHGDLSESTWDIFLLIQTWRGKKEEKPETASGHKLFLACGRYHQNVGVASQADQSTVDVFSFPASRSLRNRFVNVRVFAWHFPMAPNNNDAVEQLHI